MSIDEELSVYLRARVPLIVLVTVEEGRALDMLRKVQQDRDVHADLVAWDIAARFKSSNGATVADVATPGAALDKIAELAEAAPASRNLFVLSDFHEFWKQPDIKRKVRNLAQRLVYTGSSLVAITPTREVPIELRDEAVVVELPLPEADSLRLEMDRLIEQTRIRCDLPGSGRERLAQAAVGLTTNQARRAFSKAIVRDHVLDEQDIAAVLEEKKAVIRQNPALEFYSADETPDDIGGLEVLMKWLSLRERAFSQEAADYGLPSPKGIALIGIPGTGKSLTAKMIGGMWNLPLLRLDVGALFGSLVGESEERVREALRLAETVAPCVLWIDELEKSLSSGGQDGGTSQRVFGSILTWMQEKTKPVFIVATANDVASLRRFCVEVASTKSSSSIYRRRLNATRSSKFTCVSGVEIPGVSICLCLLA